LGLTGEPDPIESAAKGAVKAALEFAKGEIKALASRLLSGDIAFVQDQETIEEIREERGSEEFRIFKEHLEDKDLRVIALMGLTLRRMEKDPSQQRRLHNLRTKLHRRYGASSLRAAELVQRGIAGTLYLTVISESKSPADASQALENLLRSVDTYAVFVQESDKVGETVDDLVLRIKANRPRTFVVLAYGGAKTKAKSVVKGVMKKLPDPYGHESHETRNEYYSFIGVMEEGRVKIVLPALP
jgi:hypothetical protein